MASFGTSIPRLLFCVVICSGMVATVQATDPLPSWNDGKTKQSIQDFVSKVTDEKSPGFVPEPERIATFDNDGNLWAEQPMYFQLFFAVDRLRTLAPEHPEWKTHEPFASVLKGDVKSALSGGMKAVGEIVMASHAGMTRKASPLESTRT